MQNNDIEQRIISQFTKIGFVNLTNIQKQSYSIIRKKKNILLVAPTGSGKTEAAIIPIIVEILNSRPEKNKVSVLYITPLRALNRDIFERIINYTKLEGLTTEIRHGDTTRIQKRRMIENPPDVLITTPETLAILVTNKSLRTILSSVKWAIIDEFHELIGNERGTQLTLSLERLQKLSRNKIVRIGLSATLGDVNTSLKLLSGNSNKYLSEAIIDSTVREYDIEIKYLEGNLVDLKNYSDNLVILNFWATWCPPCIKEMPSLDRLQSKFDKGFKVLPISLDRDGIEEVKNFYIETKIKNLNQFFDFKNTLAKELKLFGLPTSFFVNKDGIIIAKYEGDIDWDNDTVIKFIKYLNK